SDFDLLRKNPVERMSGSSCSGFRAAKSSTVGYFWNSTGVTIFTRTSVHWAERMVATRSSQALLCFRAQVTAGDAWVKSCKIALILAGASGSSPLILRAGLAFFVTAGLRRVA